MNRNATAFSGAELERLHALLGRMKELTRGEWSIDRDEFMMLQSELHNVARPDRDIFFHSVARRPRVRS